VGGVSDWSRNDGGLDGDHVCVAERELYSGAVHGSDLGELFGNVLFLLGRWSAVSEDGETTYTVDKNFEVGQKVIISGVSPSDYNTVVEEPATIISVVQGETSSTFTIEKEVSVAYSGSGRAQASAWEYVDTDLNVTDNSEPPFKWKQVRVLSESRSFNINPETIYSKYTGSDRIIIDDESNGILVKPEQFTLYNQVIWRESTKIPV
jgi:hypothetical protein